MGWPESDSSKLDKSSAGDIRNIQFDSSPESLGMTKQLNDGQVVNQFNQETREGRTKENGERISMEMKRHSWHILHMLTWT